jgi:hypothetical protein
LETPKIIWEKYVGNFNRLVKNFFKKFHPVRIPERRVPSKHLVDDTSNAPPINSPSMSFSFDDFWGQVLGSSTDRHGQLLVRTDCFRESEVSELQVAIFIQ